MNERIRYNKVHKGTRLLVHKVDEFIIKFLSPQMNEFEMNKSKITKSKSRRVHNTDKQHTYIESDRYKIP